jgi:hypothetical protein
MEINPTSKPSKAVEKDEARKSKAFSIERMISSLVV